MSISAPMPSPQAIAPRKRRKPCGTAHQDAEADHR
jgi:hypothetical protein